VLDKLHHRIGVFHRKPLPHRLRKGLQTRT
jgi:hypothetical protein